MSELSVKLPVRVRKRLGAMASRSNRSESAVAVEAITAFLDSEESQAAEIRKGMEDADRGRVVGHDRVAEWLKTWGEGSRRVR